MDKNHVDVMISIEEINKEILELEKKDTSYTVVERLAWLYIVKNHMTKEVEKTGRMGETEFLIACSEVPIDSLLNIINEHMEQLKAIYPKSYYAILNKIKNGT